MTAAAAETRSTTGTNTADGSWLSTIVEVNLKGQGLRRLQALEQLTALRKACFADNELSLIQGLSACTALQDLSLQVSHILHAQH